MKISKKLVKVLLIGIILLLVAYMDIHVINSFQDQKKLKSFIKNMDNYENYIISINANIESKENNNLEIKFKGQVDEKNNKYFYKLKLNNANYIVYSEKDLDKYITYNYLKSIKKWQRSESEYSIIASSHISKLLKSVSKFYSIKSENKSLKKYYAYVDLNNLLPFSYSSEFDKQYSIDSLKFNKKGKIYIYVDSNNNIVKLKLNILDFLDTKEIKNSDELTKFDVEISFSKINKLEDFSMTDEVKNNLYVPSNNDSQKEVKEEDIMYNIVLASIALCQNQTIDFTKYNHELDEFLANKDYPYMISEGIIQIDNACNIEIEKDFKINHKSCSYSISGNISCK